MHRHARTIDIPPAACGQCAARETFCRIAGFRPVREFSVHSVAVSVNVYRGRSARKSIVWRRQGDAMVASGSNHDPIYRGKSRQAHGATPAGKVPDSLGRFRLGVISLCEFFFFAPNGFPAMLCASRGLRHFLARRDCRPLDAKSSSSVDRTLPLLCDIGFRWCLNSL
mmetsp:Transcript_22451/g.53364  ORF Transcript_22451/g.53364 Transcript_22451/m.53364 type:complete len:168 (+) Transcript_22451:230-733(+)